MNIKRAKDEIKNSIRAYLSKDEFGEYKIPVVSQRPILVMGPPGIGKTAIMEQVARECEIGLVAYTITHHTRQSAIGLPYIEKRQYDGREYSITEYTMSEIIASVYEKIESTGQREGILFIDEINCVSETLSATMLQFLQGKSFGAHKVPEGWVIVAAGNPPEYNKSVREFDIVTLDRVRRIDVEEDYQVWKEYAYRQSVHGAIISYLDMKRENFYRVETTIDGKRFVTARGWEDLSRMLYMYEELSIPMDEGVIYQYLQHEKIAKDFSNYLDFYYKYKNEYNMEQVLNGTIAPDAVVKLSEAPFDEKISAVGLLLSKLYTEFKEVEQIDGYVTRLFVALKQVKELFYTQESTKKPLEKITWFLQREETAYEQMKSSGRLDKKQDYILRQVLETINEYKKSIHSLSTDSNEECFIAIKKAFDGEVAKRQIAIADASDALSNAFTFMEHAFGESQEMVLFITELTMNCYSSNFISEYGSPQYYHYNQDIMFTNKRNAVLDEIQQLQNELKN